MPTLRLLGPVLLDGQPLPDHLTTHLLVLLALHPGGLPRARIAATMWPGFEPEAAGRNLRKTLHRLRSEGLGGLVESRHERLHLAAQHDLEVLQASGLAPAERLAAMRGPLGDGLRDDAGWLAEARADLLSQWADALLAALPDLPAAEAKAELRRLRALLPEDEDLQEAEQALRAGQAQRRPSVTPAAREPVGALPAAPLGRDDELQTLAEWLGTPGVCVVVHGPGGIGKTTLAAAAAAGHSFAWWAMAAAGGPRRALAEALGLEAEPEASLEDRAAAALTQRPLLLVGDEAETHVDDDALWHTVARLRQRAPAARWLFTTRSALPVAPAHRLALGGLDTPAPEDPAAALQRAPAVRFFAACAQADDPGFDPRAHGPALGRIVRAAGGHPLALQRIAAWLGSASPVEVADALEAGSLPEDLGELQSRAWQALPAGAARALPALAQLPAGLDRAGALEVAPLSVADFDALVRQAWLVREPDTGMWTLHPLARAWLRAAHPLPEAALQALDERHERHWRQRLRRAVADSGPFGAGVQALWELHGAHLEKLAERAVAMANAPLLADLHEPLVHALEQAGRRPAAVEWLARAAAALAAAEADATWRLPLEAARCNPLLQMGRRAEADGVLAEVQRLARGRRDPAARALASAARAIPLLVDGRRAEALQGLRQALQLAPTCGLAHRLPQWLTLAGHCAAYLGLYAEAERLLRQAVAAAAEPRSPTLHAQAVSYLSTTLVCAGRPHEARQLLESTWDPSLPLLQRARLAMSLADACLYAGDAAALGVTLPRARDAVRLAHHLSLELILDLIETAHLAHQGQYRQGWALVNTMRARALAGGMPLFERILPRYAAELWAAQGQRAPALHWLARVRRDATLPAFERTQAQRLWEKLAPDAAEAALAQDGPDADFGAQVQAMAAST